MKFQIFNTDKLVSKTDKEYSYFKNLEYSIDTWREIIMLAQSNKLKVFFDIFDLESAEQINQLNPDGYKIHISDVSNKKITQRSIELGKTGYSFGREDQHGWKLLKLLRL